MDLNNHHQIPEAIVGLLEKHVTVMLDVLSDNLTGVYLHGSAAMGGFTVEQSDVDYVALIAEPLEASERHRLAIGFLEIFAERAPGKGVEMSIVLERYAGPDFRYPTPYEFHFGTEEQIRQHASPHETEMADADLAAHFTMIKHRGICIYGKPIDDVFADVPKEYYLDSIIADSEESFRNILAKTNAGPCRVPTYAVLNFCRVLAYVESGLITSKLEGAIWGLANVPSEFHSLILAARGEYTNDGSHLVSGELLKRFALYTRMKYLGTGID